jgi:Mor family transcriptional regulator
MNLIIDRFEEDKAILITDDNQTIVWPKNKLPAGLKEGSALTLAIVNDKIRSEESQKLAKDILNEILKPEDAPE